MPKSNASFDINNRTPKDLPKDLKSNIDINLVSTVDFDLLIYLFYLNKYIYYIYTLSMYI